MWKENTLFVGELILLERSLQEQVIYITLGLIKQFKLIKCHLKNIVSQFTVTPSLSIFLEEKTSQGRSLDSVKNIHLKNKNGVLLLICRVKGQEARRSALEAKYYCLEAQILCRLSLLSICTY